MLNIQFVQLVNYLNSKGVPFLVKEENNSFEIIGVKVIKKGKFFRANGKIISKQFALYFI